MRPEPTDVYRHGATDKQNNWYEKQTREASSNVLFSFKVFTSAHQINVLLKVSVNNMLDEQDYHIYNTKQFILCLFKHPCFCQICIYRFAGYVIACNSCQNVPYLLDHWLVIIY